MTKGLTGVRSELSDSLDMHVLSGFQKLMLVFALGRAGYRAQEDSMAQMCQVRDGAKITLLEEARRAYD